MEKDIDIKLYNEYLQGKKESFELLYNKYKSKIQYFVFNIVKDYEKAEDITQEVFMYILKNNFKQECSFKCYIYIIAKSRAINYLKNQERKKEIDEKYLLYETNLLENDIADTVERNETRKNVINAINLLDDKYKNAIYLVKIEGLSYKETAKILGEKPENVKNLVHRGKKNLRKILIKKGYDEMNKVSKTIIIILLISLVLGGVVYAVSKIYEGIKGKAEITPTTTSKISTVDTNKVWIGTFNLVWNDFMNDVIGTKIEFEDGPSKLADELNKQTFKEEDLSESAYYKVHGESNFDLKEKIEKNIKEKFNENSKILDKVEWGNPNSYTLYAMLKKEFNYLEKFPTLNDATFGDSKELVKYFGINPSTADTAKVNVEILFYDSKEDFAVKLKTKEGENVLLYKTDGIAKSFDEIYSELLEKQNSYTGSKVLEEYDSIKIPFIKVSDEINYDELCGRIIKNTDWYIIQALQTVDFELNNYGGSVKSEALIEALKDSVITESGKKFEFTDDFVLFLKEESKQKPYFALKVDNTDVLVSGEEE